MSKITELTALELAQRIKRRKLSVRDVVTAYLNNIEKLDGALNCYNTVCAEYALKRADEVQKGIDSGTLSGRLAGVPIGIKDNISTKGIRTTCSSKMLENYIPSYDATVIKRINDEGMIILGKLNMDEFAMGSTGETSYFGCVKNPYDLTRAAGGSSGGSAAAVAAGLAAISLGSDTGGSVRLPCTMCSVTGLKPSYGSVSRYGLIAYASSLDVIGPIGKTASDCAALFDIISGKDYMDATSTNGNGFSFNATEEHDIAGKRIAVPEECLGSLLNAEIKESVLKAAEEFEKLGCEIEYVSLPTLKYAIPAYYIIASAQASSNLARYDGVRYGYRSDCAQSVEELFVSSRTEGFGSEAKKRIMLGSFVLSAGYYDLYYKKALKAQSLIRSDFDKVLKSFDFILSPVAPNTAAKLGESLADPVKMYSGDIYNVTANLTGIPSVALPCGKDSKGLPTGFQLMGKPFCEAELLAAANAFQKATRYHKLYPSLREEAEKK